MPPSSNTAADEAAKKAAADEAAKKAAADEAAKKAAADEAAKKAAADEAAKKAAADEAAAKQSSAADDDGLRPRRPVKVKGKVTVVSKGKTAQVVTDGVHVWKEAIK